MKSLHRIASWVVLLSVGLTLLGACAAAPRPEMLSMDKSVSYGESEQMAAAPMATAAPMPSTEDRAAGSALENVTADQMIIRTGNLSLVVANTEESMALIKTLVEGLEGYVANSSAYLSGEQMRGSMMVRVPAASFDTAIEQCKKLAVRVQSENTDAQDVTEEYSDLSARLRNLEATEKELLELLTTVRERTNKAEDILAVYRELTAIREQIEQIKGRMQYLERLTALATISIELIPDEVTKPISEPTWQPSVTARNAWRTLVRAMQGLVNFLITFGIVGIPLLALAAGAIALFLAVIRRITKNKRQKKQPTPPPQA